MVRGFILCLFSPVAESSGGVFISVGFGLCLPVREMLPLGVSVGQSRASVNAAGVRATAQTRKCFADRQQLRCLRLWLVCSPQANGLCRFLPSRCRHLPTAAPPAVHGGKNHPTQFSTQILLKKAGERAGF
jgi:hypothetical protein